MPFSISVSNQFNFSSENTYGEDLAVAPAATITLVSFIADKNWDFFGIIAGGESDAIFTVEFDGVVSYRTRTNIARRRGDFMLSHPDSTARNTTVTVKVTNEGSITSVFEATLIGGRRI